VAALFLGHIRIVIGPTPLIVFHRYGDPDPGRRKIYTIVTLATVKINRNLMRHARE